jgi:hypothetical protein
MLIFVTALVLHTVEAVFFMTQETYMIIDQSSIQSEDGQQLFIVGGGEEEGEETQHHQYQILQVGGFLFSSMVPYSICVSPKNCIRQKISTL